MAMISLPLAMEDMFNRPLAITDTKAAVIIQAITGQVGFEAISDDMPRPGGLQPVEHMTAARGAAAPGATIEGLMWYGERPYQLTDSGTAVIRIDGSLCRSSGRYYWSYGRTGYDQIWAQLLFAQDDVKVERIFLMINSNGGTVDGMFDLMDGIYQASARFGGKPIHAHAGDFAYSAAYGLMSSADTCSTPATGGVGSAACLMIHLDMTKMFEEAGVKPTIFRSGTRKAIGTGGMEPLDDEEIKHRQDLIDFMGGELCSRVERNRGLASGAISKLQGRDYNGVQAKALGLINSVLSEPQAWLQHERRAA